MTVNTFESLRLFQSLSICYTTGIVMGFFCSHLSQVHILVWVSD